MAEIGTDSKHASAVLNAGGLVAIPTETVYGLAANALDAKAIVKIFEAKNRPFFDPLIVHTHSIAAAQLLADFNPLALQLAEHFWPGPLTLLLPRTSLIPDLVTSGLDTVGIRIPSHPLTLELLRQLSFPLAAPSANPFGYVSPTSAQHVNDQLGNKIDYILDGGASTVGLESTIVGFEGGKVTVFRLGGLSIENIEAVVKQKVNVELNTSSNPQSPGMLKSHYAPSKPFYIGYPPDFFSRYPLETIGVLSFRYVYPEVLPGNQIALSATGDLNEAARNLFKAMRILDKKEISVIIAEPFPETGIGRAINDRLRRAAHRD